MSLKSFIKGYLTEKAAEEWVERYGSIWRNEKESLEQNGFIGLSILIKDKKGISIEIGALAGIARRRNCELYIHKDRMKYYNFILFGKKEYLNVKSILCPKVMEAVRGELVEIIATGNEVKEALEETEHFIHTLESD